MIELFLRSGCQARPRPRPDGLPFLFHTNTKCYKTTPQPWTQIISLGSCALGFGEPRANHMPSNEFSVLLLASPPPLGKRSKAAFINMTLYIDI